MDGHRGALEGFETCCAACEELDSLNGGRSFEVGSSFEVGFETSFEVGFGTSFEVGFGTSFEAHSLMCDELDSEIFEPDLCEGDSCAMGCEIFFELDCALVALDSPANCSQSVARSALSST